MLSFGFVKSGVVTKDASAGHTIWVYNNTGLFPKIDKDWFRNGQEQRGAQD